MIYTEMEKTHLLLLIAHKEIKKTNKHLYNIYSTYGFEQSRMVHWQVIRCSTNAKVCGSIIGCSSLHAKYPLATY